MCLLQSWLVCCSVTWNIKIGEFGFLSLLQTYSWSIETVLNVDPTYVCSPSHAICIFPGHICQGIDRLTACMNPEHLHLQATAMLHVSLVLGRV
jgi:hypothetical protein